MQLRRQIVGWLLLMLTVSFQPASANLLPLIHESVWIDSGVHHGLPGKEVVAWREIISYDGAPWIRLHFDDHYLGEWSVVVITSIADGQRQTLDRQALEHWYDYSACFAGDAVQIELIAGPGEEGVFVVVDEITVPDQTDRQVHPAVGPTEPPIGKSLCGGDDGRDPSSDPRVGRLQNFSTGGSCTGWLIPNGGALTAGHCGVPDGNLAGVIMHFNVPPSTVDGIAMPATVVDQFPVANGSWSSQNNGEGEDWAIFTLNPNTAGNAHDIKGYFLLTSGLPPEGGSVRVTGNGVDMFPPGPGPATCNNGEDFCNSSNLTQQTDAGVFEEMSGTAIQHEVDTMPGGSGSPVIWNQYDYAIGIHTNGGCDDIFSGYDNAGTWVQYQPLRNAIEALNPPGRVWVDAKGLSSAQLGQVVEPWVTVASGTAGVPNGGEVVVVSGTYTAASGNTFVAGADGRAMVVIAVLGDAVIGQ